MPIRAVSTKNGEENTDHRAGRQTRETARRIGLTIVTRW